MNWVIKNLLKHPFDYSKRLMKLFSHMRTYNKLNTRPDFHASLRNMIPCVYDWDAPAGLLGYYFWQDLWASKKIFQVKPAEHFDIGSRVDGFIAHILTFMPVTLIDIRPLPHQIENLRFIQSDATNLENIPDDSLISLSSLCAPEHFGLGRYTDAIDPEACFKAMRSMQRVLKKGGHLYIAVPVGERDGVAFNAHRIYRPETVINTMDKLTLADFTIADESKGKVRYIEHIDYREFDNFHFGMNYDAFVEGFFEFVK